MLQLSIELVIFLFPLAYSPGPGNLFFAANGARFGFMQTLPASCGYHMATWLVTALIGFSLVNVANVYQSFFVFIGYLGSAYVLYLAWTFFHAGATGGQSAVKPASFWSGAILLLLNPKAYVIIALMFSQFLTAHSNAFHVMWITTVFTVNNWVAFSIWTYIGDKLLSQFRNERDAKKLNMTFGGILAIIALWLFIKT